MSGTVSTRWFWSDWMSDTGLRQCGYAARGLWKDMLCIAAANKGDDYGYVMLNGRKLDTADIARLTGGTVKEADELIQELERNGVFSRTRTRIIYCRRMVRTQINRTNGKLGGNPNLLKDQPKPISVKRKPKPLIPEPEPKPDSKTLGAPAPSVPVDDWPDDYREQFWNRYPRKTERQAALKKLDMVRKSRKVTWVRLMAGIDRLLANVEGDEERYTKHPTTWLNRGCWDDQHKPKQKPQTRNGHAALALRFMQEEDDEQPDGVDVRGPTVSPESVAGLVAMVAKRRDH